MRIGLLSDSHGRAARTREAVRLLLDRGAEILLHMGDIETEEVIDQLAGLDARIVFGNNDDERSLGAYASSLGVRVLHPLGRLEAGGRTIAFTHGHIGSCMREGSGADYLVHGHTHRQRDERRGATRVINPGALHRAHPYSVALLDPEIDALDFIVVPSETPHRYAAAMSSRRAGSRRLPRPGLPPGTMTPDPAARATTVRAFAFSQDAYEETTIADPSMLGPMLEKWPVVWVDVEGLGDADLLRRIAEVFRIHPLAMEDVVDTSQRAKVEPYGEVTFIVAPMPHLGPGSFTTEQLSICVGANWVVTFQDAPLGDCLGVIRDRIRLGRGRVRSNLAPYLAYALVDAVIDGYFPVVESLGERLDDLERSVLESPKHEQVTTLRSLKHELARLRRAIWPMRDALTTMMTLDTVFSSELRLYVRDAHDHVVRLMDIIETDRAMASDLVEIHLSAVSARLGEVNKFLTVIATIFLPLSWIAGIYGMNFEFMPEIHQPWGYPTALLLMVFCAGGLLLYFFRKGWLAPSVFGTGRGTSARRSADDAARRLSSRSSELHPPR